MAGIGSCPAGEFSAGEGCVHNPDLVIDERYLRGWLAGIPLETRKSKGGIIAAIIDGIERADIDLGGSVESITSS